MLILFDTDERDWQSVVTASHVGHFQSSRALIRVVEFVRLL